MLTIRTLVLLTSLLGLVACGKKIEDQDERSNRAKRSAQENALDQAEALFMAIENGDEGLVRAQLSRGSNPNTIYNRQTALGQAIVLDHIEIVRVLFNAGARIDLADQDDKTPMILAIELDRQDIFHYLIARDALKSYKDKLSLLIAAVKNGREDMAIELVITGAVSNMRKAIFYAEQQGMRKLVHFLGQIKKLPEINQDLIIKFVTEGNYDLLRYAGNKQKLTDLAAGADLLSKAQGIKIPATRTSVVEYLLSQGLSPDGQTPKDKYIPLIVAAQRNDLLLVKTFISAGANANLVDVANRTALAYAVQHLNSEMVEFLMANGASRRFTVKLNNNREILQDSCSFLRLPRSRAEQRAISSTYNSIRMTIGCN